MHIYEVESKYQIGQIVYFRTCEESLEWVVVAIIAYADHVEYMVAVEGEQRTACFTELTGEKRIPGVKYN